MRGGIVYSSRNILYGPVGTGKTVFAMQFLWQEVQSRESVAFDVMNKQFSGLMSYFKSFGWNIEPYMERAKFIVIQAFYHFETCPEDPRAIYSA